MTSAHRGKRLVVSVLTSVLVALALTLALAVAHLLAPRLRSLPFVPEAATGSFAGGLAIAYVFLHLLPEVAEGNVEVGEALGETLEVTPLLDLVLFLTALAGFTAFYGLERLADRHHPRPQTGAEPSGGGEFVYRLHLSAFLVYNGLITYTMALRVRSGLAFALLFTLAIGLHFVLTDRGLEEHYGARFGRSSRWALGAALLGGWALGAVAAPTDVLAVSALTAFVGGSILLNVFKEELPDARRSHFGWFVVGLVLYAALLLLVTAVQE